MRRAGCSPPGSAATKRLGLPDRLAHGGIDLSRGGARRGPARPGPRLRALEVDRRPAPGLVRRWQGGSTTVWSNPARHMELSGALKARWVPPLCRLAIDPDGRMLRLQREGEL